MEGTASPTRLARVPIPPVADSWRSCKRLRISLVFLGSAAEKKVSNATNIVCSHSPPRRSASNNIARLRWRWAKRAFPLARPRAIRCAMREAMRSTLERRRENLGSYYRQAQETKVQGIQADEKQERYLLLSVVVRAPARWQRF
jgi:hypothetical protein